MKLIIKKRIATEIIILFSSAILILIIFLLSYPYEEYYFRKWNQTENSISKKQQQWDSINSIPVDMNKGTHW